MPRPKLPELHDHVVLVIREDSHHQYRRHRLRRTSCALHLCVIAETVAGTALSVPTRPCVHSLEQSPPALHLTLTT